MAEKKNLTIYNLHFGKILKAKKAGVRLVGFELPQLDNRFTVITAKELPNENSISFLGSEIPIFAEDKIDFPGQPLLALFGPDYESVTLALRNIKVKTAPLPEVKQREESVPHVEFCWGQEELPKREALEAMPHIESTFSYDHTVYDSDTSYTITAWQEGKDLNIELPTQWPDNVKKAAATLSGWGENNINITTQRWYTHHDDYLLWPSIYAAIASVMVLKTGLSVQIKENAISAKPGYKIKKTTYFSQDGKPFAENVEMSVDQGAYTIASTELQRQAMTGLLPLYSLKAFFARIDITVSQRMPAAFCGSLGYDEALAATEYHTSRLAHKGDMTPLQLRDLIIRGKTRFTDYAAPIDIDNLRGETNKIAEGAIYNRKWITNHGQHGDFGLVGFLRGIGFANGLGIAGFSSAMAKESQFSSMMTFTKKHNVTINTSVSYYNVNTEYWKDLVESKFTSSEDDPINCLLLEHNNETLDSGPEVLSRFICCYPMQLASAAKHLNILRATEKLPISIKYDAESAFSPCEFTLSGFGSMIIEVSVSKCDFRPLVQEIWASFCLSPSSSDSYSRETIKRNILTTLSDAGGVIPDDFKMHIDFVPLQDSSKGIAAISASSVALTMASFANALYELGGQEASNLPTSAEKLERILGGNK